MRVREDRYREGYARDLVNKRVYMDEDRNVEQMGEYVDSAKEVCGSVRVG